MHARLLLAVAALVVTTLASGTAPAMARDLTIVVRGNALSEAELHVFDQPFVGATGIAVRQQKWSGGIDALRAQMKSPNNDWDMVQVSGDELLAGCQGGLFEKIDWSAVGGKDHYLPQAISDCGVGSTLSSTLLAWDKDKFQHVPNWADFWDVAKYPGKRGLRAGVRGNLEIALIADGVSPGDVYKVLATSEGVDRAFHKLDQLKPYIVWWHDGAEAAHILASGDVLMTSAPSNRIAMADRTQHRHFGMQWATSLYDVTSWAVLKGSPGLPQALQFLYFSGTPAVETRLFRIAGLAGLAKGANDGLSPEELAQSPTAPANLAGAVRMDAAFWNENGAKLRQRFDAWMTAR